MKFKLFCKQDGVEHFSATVVVYCQRRTWTTLSIQVLPRFAYLIGQDRQKISNAQFRDITGCKIPEHETR